MAVMVATRLKMSSARYVPRFLVGSFSVARQARRTPGFITGRLRAEPGGGFWTITVWESGLDMAVFRDSGVHAVLAPKLAGWADEAVFGVWNCEDVALPSWKSISQQVAEHPNFAPLDHPAPAHVAQHFKPSRRFGFDLPIPHPRRRRAVAA
jgi:hypothetical protein